ncbi:MAG TPA: hypothetical protein ENN22_12490 [bacterium]|nr:hypothetical protein [bacterium]
MKMPKHHPKHYYLNDTVYFITAHIYKRRRYLDADDKKQLLFEIFQQTFSRFNYRLYAWVILEDHYHIQFKTRIGDDFIKAIQQIHNDCLHRLNQSENRRRRKIFYNFWDYCIRSKMEFYSYFNFIHYNPVKHGYVSDMAAYPFSSYADWRQKKGELWLASCMRDFPISEFSIPQDENFD